LREDWEILPFGEVCEISGGSQPPKVNFIYEPREGYVRLVQVRDYKTDKYVTYIPIEKAKKFCTSEDIMIGRYGPPIFGIFSGIEGAYNVALMKAIPNEDKLDKEYFRWFLKSHDLVRFVEKTSKRAAGQDGVRKERLYQFPVPIPPLPEQKAIVKILNEAFTKIDQAKVNIERNINNVKELFQSFLNSAIEGKLSKKYRESIPDYKQNLECQFQDLLTEIESISRKKGRKSEKTKGHEVVLDIIPKDWSITSVESIFNIIDYRGKTPVKSDRGKRLITAKNIRNGYLEDRPIEYVSEETYKTWMTRGFPKLGDIFFVTEGHTIGFVALNTRVDEFALAQRTITLQPAVSFSTKYFFYYLLSEYFKKIVILNATGAAAVGIKASKFKDLPIPFPSFSEQALIVEKLDSISAKINSLNSKYNNELASMEELKKSLLQKAFSGELTKTEALA